MRAFSSETSALRAGFEVARSFGRKYVEFEQAGAIGFGLYGRKVAAGEWRDGDP